MRFIFLFGIRWTDDVKYLRKLILREFKLQRHADIYKVVTENEPNIFWVVSLECFFRIKILSLKLHAVFRDQNVTVVSTFVIFHAACSNKSFNKVNIGANTFCSSVLFAERLILRLGSLVVWRAFFVALMSLYWFPESLHLCVWDRNSKCLNSCLKLNHTQKTILVHIHSDKNIEQRKLFGFY